MCPCRVLAAVAVAVKSTSSALSPRLALFGHLLSFSTWLGSVLYTTFVLGIVAFKNLPRQTFGRLQSKLFPMYDVQPPPTTYRRP